MPISFNLLTVPLWGGLPIFSACCTTVNDKLVCKTMGVHQMGEKTLGKS